MSKGADVSVCLNLPAGRPDEMRGRKAFRRRSVREDIPVQIVGVFLAFAAAGRAGASDRTFSSFGSVAESSRA